MNRVLGASLMVVFIVYAVTVFCFIARSIRPETFDQYPLIYNEPILKHVMYYSWKPVLPIYFPGGYKDQAIRQLEKESSRILLRPLAIQDGAPIPMEGKDAGLLYADAYTCQKVRTVYPRLSLLTALPHEYVFLVFQRSASVRYSSITDPRIRKVGYVDIRDKELFEIVAKHMNRDTSTLQWIPMATIEQAASAVFDLGTVDALLLFTTQEHDDMTILMSYPFAFVPYETLSLPAIQKDLPFARKTMFTVQPRPQQPRPVDAQSVNALTFHTLLCASSTFEHDLIESILKGMNLPMVNNFYSQSIPFHPVTAKWTSNAFNRPIEEVVQPSL